MQYLQASFAVALGSKEFREGYAKIDWSMKWDSNKQDGPAGQSDPPSTKG